MTSAPDSSDPKKPGDQNPDSLQQVRAEFLAYLEQNEAGGTAWYLDEGPVDPLPVVPSTNPEPVVDSPPKMEKPPVKASEPPAPVQPTPTPTPAAPAGDPFAAECQAFVTETLRSMQRQGLSWGPRPAVENPQPQLAQLSDQVTGCQQCPLHESRNSVVFGAGSAQADVLFIGEAPGRDEDLQGEPFVGKSGQLLTKIISAIDFSRDDIYICNILKCRPPNNRDPLPAEVACCEAHLKEQLAIIQPRVICCLGRIAAQTLLKTEASLGALRKTAHFYEGIPVMATYHPAALLRNPGWKRDTWNDVRKLRALHDALLQPTAEGA